MRLHLDGSVRDLRLTLTGFCALYLAIVVAQAVAVEEFRHWAFIGFSIATALIFFGIRWLAGRRGVVSSSAESVGSVIGLLVILNGFFHLYLLSGLDDSKGLALMGAGLCCFFMRSGRLVLFIVVSLLTWLFLGVTAGSTELWLHFVFGLFGAVGFRLYLEFGKTRLEETLALAEEEIERRKDVEAALRESKERYSLAALGSRDGIWDWDRKNNKAYFSGRWKAMLGFEEDEVGDNIDEWFDRIHPDEREAVRSAVNRHLARESSELEIECRMQCKDGSYRWFHTRGAAVYGEIGEAYRVAGSQTDITERKEAEQRLYHEAFHDGLTGLANRALFLDRLTRALNLRQRKTGYRFSILFLDLDRFKEINDSLGHLVGDELLRGVAERLKKSFRHIDTISRFGGDEFAILLDEVDQGVDPLACARRIHEELKKPFFLETREIFVGASIGIVMSDERYSRPEEILRDVDTAMYRAKTAPEEKTRLFDEQMHLEALADLNLGNELHIARRNNQLLMFYQPIVSLRSGRIIGCEALLRWGHPELGLIEAADFISAVEERGLSPDIGGWALEKAFLTVKHWQARFDKKHDLALFANFSKRQLLNGDLYGSLVSALEKTGFNPNSLVLEIREDLISNSEKKALSSLSELGIRLLLDDFGKGAYLLAHLRDWPLRMAKVDRTLIREMRNVGKGREIVRTIVNLVHDLGLEVVAEGVETEDELRQVVEMGFEYAQGYYLSRPVAADSMEVILSEFEDSRIRKLSRRAVKNWRSGDAPSLCSQ